MSNTATIPLSFPLQRGETEIKSITLHKPNSGHLRGVNMRDCLEMGADATIALVPRISDPKITPQEMLKIDPSDLLQMSAAIANFVLPPSLIAEAEQTVQAQTSGQSPSA